MIKELIILMLSLSLGSLAQAQTEESDNVSILYFTDAHEIAPVNDRHGNRGGMARLKTVIEEVRSANPTIVAFGGDLGGGTLFGGFYKGFPMVEAFNKIPVDIANFGQHEFDFGIENTIRLVRQSTFVWITSNLKDENGNNFNKLPGYYTITKSGIKIGFIGLTDALNTSITDKRIQQYDLITAAKKACAKLKAENVDYIVAITQTPLLINQQILKAVSAIDLILTEEVSEEQSKITCIGSKAIVATCGNMGSVAEINIQRISRHNSLKTSLSIYPLDSTIRPNPDLQSLENKYMTKLNADLSKVVGQAKSDMNKDGSRNRETLLANLITDAFKHYFNADIALINGGGIRANISKGKITKKDIYAVLPFGNTVCHVRLKGSEIVAIIKAGLTRVNQSGGDFIQVSGVKYGYSISEDGSAQLSFVKKDGGIIEPEKFYTVALSNYIFDGNGAYQFIFSRRLITPLSESPKDAEAVIDFLNKTHHYSSEISNRIEILSKHSK